MTMAMMRNAHVRHGMNSRKGTAPSFLLQGAGFAEIGELGPVVGARLGRARQL